ncbi:MAG: SDR family NAD(P)-dependent oxidoreductase, partial [Flavobacteriales bacterium]|nr:SDR family NAD(P)-dependent oxidoreductase [Flavobacteriales bacterium]
MNILITGITQGLGALLAQHYSKTNLVIGFSRSGDDRYEDNILNLQCDISDPDQVKSAVTKIIQKHKRIDVLINNSGILHTSPFVL